MDFLKKLITSGKTSENESSETNNRAAVRPKLLQSSFTNPDDLCDYINYHGIQPVSINTADRFYIVFYYA